MGETEKYHFLLFQFTGKADCFIDLKDLEDLMCEISKIAIVQKGVVNYTHISGVNYEQFYLKKQLMSQ